MLYVRLIVAGLVSNDTRVSREVHAGNASHSRVRILFCGNLILLYLQVVENNGFSAKSVLYYNMNPTKVTKGVEMRPLPR